MHGPNILRPEDASSTIARKLLNREPISQTDLESSSIVSSKSIAVIGALSDLLRHSDPDRVGAFYFVFESAGDITVFVKDLVRYEQDDSSGSFKRLVEQDLLRKLCIGEVSGVRVSQLFNAPGLRSLLLFGLLEDDCWILENGSATWKHAIHSILGARDRLDIHELFMHSFRFQTLGNPRPTGVCRLVSMTFVWTQGNTNAVRAVYRLIGSDAFEILELCLRVDGVSEKPAFEFEGISAFLKSFLANDETVESRIGVFLILLSRAVEKTLEMIHNTENDSNSPHVIVLDLEQGNMCSILTTFEPGFDLENAQITIDGDFSISRSLNIFETRLHIHLSPATWFVYPIPSEDPTIQSVLHLFISPTLRRYETFFQKFCAWKIGPETIQICGPTSGISVEFQLVPGGFQFSLTRNSDDLQSVDVCFNQDCRFTIPWPNLAEPVARSSGGLPTRPVLLPTTVPLLPRITDPPRTVCLIGLSPSCCSHLISPWDRIVSIQISSDPSIWRIRDMVHECAQSDLIIISSEFFDSSTNTHTSFLVGLLVGSCQNVEVCGEMDNCDFLAQLRDQGIIK